MNQLEQNHIYEAASERIEEIVGRLLRLSHKTLAIAESCSGGYASQLIVQVPGCSSYYKGGIVAYNNQIKQEVLGVSERTLLRHGVVSHQVAIEMANQVRLKFKADIGLSSTGIVGPGKEVDEINPIGTVWIGYADGNKSHAERLKLTFDRRYNIQLTAYHLLNLLRINLQSVNHINS